MIKVHESQAPNYEIDTRFREGDSSDPWSVHTTAEMIACLERDQKIELDAKILGVSGRKLKVRSLERKQFLESFQSEFKMREAMDAFSLDPDEVPSTAGSVGQDFIPLLGGPFYKNLYYYQDYIRMHNQAFFAYHHDPIAKASVSIIRDFTLGRGYGIDCEDKKALAAWKAFEEANDFPEQFDMYARELSVYGESMWWKLPQMESKITYRLPPGEIPPKGLLPRVRLIDPSNIVEIVTYPEDITRTLFYVWLTPTQYQIYTGNAETKKVQPVLKFVYRQIPAEQMLHFRVNSMSNEKRGRSDLFPALGYFKRLRDAVNYQLIALMKQAAFAVDTKIEGSQADVDAYADAQKSIGSIAPAGSEFIHTSKIERQYVSPQSGRSGQNEVFEWCLSMTAAALQIPVSYYGTHLSGGQTRASALVATEPVAKKFEMRQLVYERTIKKIWDHVMDVCGFGYVPVKITFPEIIAQDRSAKLKDLALAETQKWLSPKRAAEIAAREFEIKDYDYEAEMKDAPQDAPIPEAPLTAAPAAKPSAVTQDEKARIAANDGA